MENIVATVILTIIAVTIVIAVAYWVTGIITLYTDIEILEIKHKQVTRQSDTYIILIEIENKGTKTAKIIQVLINNKPPEDYNTIVTLSKNSVNPGETIQLQITIKAKPGTTIQISLNTEKGIQHLTTFTLN
ncbi:MAG: hypothetical protein DRJ64_01410 [Thermoprotei archaeon]|nr:MAG: hypothetical protein DRJ64_01410 [Thermoprotei archaeon]